MIFFLEINCLSLHNHLDHIYKMLIEIRKDKLLAEKTGTNT